MKTAVAKQSEGFLLTVCPPRVRLLSALTPGAIRHDPFAVSKCCWRVTSSRPHTSPPSLLLHLPSLHLVYDTRLYDITFWLLYLSLALRPPSLANSRPSHHALPAALRNARWSTCPCTGRGKAILIDSSKETRVSGQNKHFHAHHTEKRNGKHLTWIESDVFFYS